MKIKIDFKELCEAFELCSLTNHYFIDLEKNELISINDEIDDEPEKKLEEIDNEKFLIIPQRTSDDNYLIMKLFVHEIAEKDFKLFDKFYDAIHKNKPFRRFKEMLDEYPEFKEGWYKFKEKQIQNDVIDWLFENEIILETSRFVSNKSNLDGFKTLGFDSAQNSMNFDMLKNPKLPSTSVRIFDNQKLIPDFDIRELDNSEIEKFPDELKDFAPMACMNCKNEGKLLSKFFSINCDIDNQMIDYEIKRRMREKYNINNYGVMSRGKGTILTYAKCLKCGSEDIFWDY